MGHCTINEVFKPCSIQIKLSPAQLLHNKGHFQTDFPIDSNKQNLFTTKLQRIRFPQSW